MENIEKLLEVMAALRDPETGCPWDIEQNFVSIAPYTVEEAYEVADAIERGNCEDLRDELGDLLLQVVFHSQMAAEQKLFDFESVAGTIVAKLIRRHPHVFAGAATGTATEQQRQWEAHKQAERAQREGGKEGALDGLTTNLPALTLAYKTSKKAANVGFDWDNAGQVLDKIHEELDELAEADAADDKDAMAEELGDLLLAVTNLARHLQINPETALRAANRKFINRFEKLEASLQASGDDWSELTLEQMEQRWQAIK